MDLTFGGDEGTPITQPAPNPDISSLIQNYGEKASSRTSEPDSTITDEDIQRQMAIAMEAIGNVAKRSTPTYQSPDTAKYLDSLQRVRAVATDSVKDLDTQRKLFESASAQEKDAMQRAATANIAKENADQGRVQQVADIAYQVGDLVGTNGNAGRIAQKTLVFQQKNDEFLAMNEASQTLRASVEHDAAALREEQSVGFFDNPIRWMEGIFKIPQMQETVEAGMNEIKVVDNQLGTMKLGIDAIKDDINENMSIGKDSNEARSKTIPSITAQQAAAVNALTAAKATEDSAKADKNLAVQNAQFGGQRFAQVVTAENAEHSAAVLDQQRAELEWRSQIQAVAKADSDAKAKLMIVDMMTKIQDNQQVGSMLRMYETRMGLPTGSMTLSRYKSLPDKSKEFVFGQALGFTGATPGDAFFNMVEAAQGGLQPGPAISVQTDKMLRDMKAFVQAERVKPSVQQELSGKNKDQQRAILVEKMNERYQQLQSNPQMDANVNPFYEQSPANVALHSPSIAQSKIGKILQPMITGTSVPNTDMVIATLKVGAANPDEAAKMISQYYQLNTKIKNSVTDFQAFGAKPTDSYFYNYRLPGSIFSGTTARVDLTNEVEVKNMILKQQKSELLQKTIQEGNATNRGF